MAKVRFICKQLQEAARTPGKRLLSEWCALYNQVVTVLEQDTSLWKSDFITALLEHKDLGIDLDKGFDNIEAIEASIPWRNDASSPATPGRVEQLPYLSGLLLPQHLSPRGSAVFTKFMPD